MDDYKQFVVNFNMNNMEKTIHELHSMLKTATLSMVSIKPKDIMTVEGGIEKKWRNRKARVVSSPISSLKERERARRPNKPKQLKQVMLELRILVFTVMKLIMTNAIA